MDQDQVSEAETFVVLLWTKKFLVGGVSLFFMISVYIYSFTITPTYMVSTILEPRVESNSMSGLMGRLAGASGGIFGGILGGGGNAAKSAALKTLTSNSFLQDFVIEEGAVPYLYQARGGENEIDNLKNMSADELRSNPETRRSIDTLRRFVIGVDNSPITGLVTLSVSLEDPDVAVRWANNLVKLANEKIRQDAIEESQQKIDFLHKEYSNNNVESVRAAISSLLENELKSIMIASVSEEYGFKVIDPAFLPVDGYYQRPRHAMLAVVGGIIGFSLSLLFLFALHFRDAARRLQSKG